MEFKTIKGQKNFLYSSEEEFHEHRPERPVRHRWSDGEDGEWVFTDDNYVCQILKKFPTKRGDCVRTVLGTYNVGEVNYKMLGENGVAENIYSFSGKTKEVVQQNEDRNFLFAQYVARGDDVISAYKKAYPNSNSEGYIKTQTSKLLKTEKVQKMIKEEVLTILDDEGVTPQYLIRRYKDVADLSENDNAILRSLDSLSKISGLFDTDEKKTEQLTVWAGFSPEQLEAIKGDDNDENTRPKILAQAERKEKIPANAERESEE